MNDRFRTRVLDPIQARLGQKLKPPRREGLVWGYDEDDGHRTVRLDIDAGQLVGNVRNDGPSAPVFALCLAAELGETDGDPTRTLITVVGRGPDRPGFGYKTSRELLQFRRSAFLLHALSELLGDRFVVEMHDDDRWEWPKWTFFSVEGYRKNKGPSDKGRGRLAWEFELNPDVYKAFCAEVEPIQRFQPLMPTVVHSGEVTKDSHWTVGGKNGVPLWVAAKDDRRLHLFELDSGSRGSIGTLAEALCNGLMLDYVFEQNGHYDPSGVGLKAVRRARRMSFWLTAQAYHPLVFDREAGPSAVLTSLNRALRTSSFQLGVLPWEGEVTSPSFAFEELWGGGLRR
ncbi:MAG: hypothetical protein KDA24_11110 [Deltaproteobacteria bacterium]|nr:hypothetical protein [Deltaproteobacteria bacterium]